MMLIKNIYYCDKCGKKIGEEKPEWFYFDLYRYNFCEDCQSLYNEFMTQFNNLMKEADELEKKYKFGKYMEEKNGK